MRKRRQKVALAAGLAAMPLLFLQQSASAAESTDIESGSLEFLTVGGSSVRCGAMVDATHDTDDADAPLLTWNTEAAESPECAGSFKIIATYGDANGTTRSVRYTASEPTFGGVDGAYSPTSVTLEIDYTQCDPGANASCTLTVTASPK
jgi:hypothetical protein